MEQNNEPIFSVIPKKSTITDDDRQRLLNIFKRMNTNIVWSKVENFNDFHAERFKTGNVNDICWCKLSDEFCQQKRSEGYKDQDFIGIVVKFYTEFDWFKVNSIERAVINTIISSKGFSPKLLFIDDKCQVDEYIEGRHYNYDDDCDENTVRKLAKELAQFHSINPVPISRFGFDQWIAMEDDKESDFYKILCVEKLHLKMIEQNPEFKAKYYDIIASMDMEKDNELLKKTVKKIGTQLILSHNDFNRQNRLIQFDKNGNKRIYFIDLDFTNYYYRGLDLGRYFSNYRHHDDMFGNEGFPDDNEMDLFLNEYRMELSKSQSSEWLNDPKNSLEHFRDESKIFTLKAYSIDAGFAVMMFVQNPTTDKFLIIAKNRYEGFLQLKKRFTDDGTIPRILAE
ncbi:hypothetical protein DERP_011786 [Dermatophagoides pteronyssinus]|uniref:Uncharacterized protein n=1 Tax=Dermatophagoides pteronyssinus TaxID=6956 RepID=A0ABQ8JRP3_DERPT|nr:hypothetical protein DERP_011786 [Dermatophagoides pteronyssinus]